MQSRRRFIKVMLGFVAALVAGVALPVKVPLDGQAQSAPSKQVALKPDPSAAALSRNAMDDIIALADPALQGREAGTIGETKAANYITGQLQALGVVPLGDVGYEHVFTIPQVVEKVVDGRLTFRPGDKDGLRIPSANLVGKINGQDPNEIIIISAHYDHLGIYHNQVYRGANDNASGVGCILDVLRRLQKTQTMPRATIVAAFWSAEEMGFVGSQAFVQRPTIPLHKVKAVINVDTVGNGPLGQFGYWADAENLATKALQMAGKAAGASVKPEKSYGHNSDQSSFAKVGIPSLTLLAWDWLVKNHTVADTPGLIEPAQVNLAEDIVYRTVQILTGM